MVDQEKLRQLLGAMRPEFTNVDWTALARKVLVENPQQAWRELPGKLQASRDLLNQYEPGKPISQELLDQMLGLTSFGGVTKSVKPAAENFAAAMKTAQKNAAKPVSEGGLGLPKNNTPADRAKAMGFDTRVYHGTADDIQAIDPAMFGSTTGAKTGKAAFWTTDSPEVARTYAEFAAKNAKVQKLIDQADKAGQKGQWDKYDELLVKAEELEAQFAREYGSGQTIMPFLVKGRQMGVQNMEGRSFDDVGVSDEILQRILGSVKYDKQPGVAFQNLDDAVGRVNLPATHYAITDPTAIRSQFAAFDPMRAQERNILAGMFPLTMSRGLLDEEER